MKRILGLVFILALFLAGCSDEGILRIKSNSSEDVWYQVNNGSTEWLSSGEAESYSWDLSTSIFGEEDKKVTVTYGGGEWFWYDSYEVNKTIKPGSTANVEIIGDTGEIKIVNDTDYTSIYYIYISPSSSTEWGEDLLGSDILYPGYYISWLVTTGYWDIMFIDEDGWEYTFMNQLIDPETIYTYTLADAKRSSDPIGEKIANSQKYTEKIAGKCRRK